MLHNLTNFLGSISSASNHLHGVGWFDSTVWITCSSDENISPSRHSKGSVCQSLDIALPNCTIRSTLDFSRNQFVAGV